MIKHEIELKKLIIFTLLPFSKMVRKVIIPDSENISITLPESFVGKQVQVIAYTIGDEVEIETSFNADKPLTHLASSEALAEDWLSPEEDKAWEDL